VADVGTGVAVAWNWNLSVSSATSIWFSGPMTLPPHATANPTTPARIPARSSPKGISSSQTGVVGCRDHLQLSHRTPMGQGSAM